MRDVFPAPHKRLKPVGPPALEFLVEGGGERVREEIAVGWRSQGRERNRLAIRQFRCGGEVHTHADYDRIAFAFEQDARELGVAQHQVIGPFEPQPAGHGEDLGYRLVGRHARDQRQRRRIGIAFGHMDHRRAHEIAAAVEPGPSLPAAPRHLSVRHQPLALGHGFTGAQLRGEVGIGRTGFGNEADHIAAMNEAAACAVHSPSGMVSR